MSLSHSCTPGTTLEVYPAYMAPSTEVGSLSKVM